MHVAVPLSKELTPCSSIFHASHQLQAFGLGNNGVSMSVVNNIKMGSIKPVKRNVPFVIIKFAQ